MHSIGPEANWLGLNVQGDIGPITLYTSARGKLVGFLRAPPLNPPTAKQQVIRERFQIAATKWREATATTRLQWRQLARKANLGITGYNLWTWFCYTANEASLRSLELTTGQQVTRPT